jgi:flagellar hook assembly protein FlgD
MQSATRFEIEAAAPGEASLGVYDVGGRRVREVRSGWLPAGRHVLSWDGADDRGVQVPGGVYFYRVALGAEHRDGKLVVVR